MRILARYQDKRTSWACRPPLPIAVLAHALGAAAFAATCIMLVWTYQHRAEVSGLAYALVTSIGVVGLGVVANVWASLTTERKGEVDYATGRVEIRWLARRVLLDEAEVAGVSLRRFQNICWNDWFIILVHKNGRTYDLGREIVFGFRHESPKELREFVEMLSASLHCRVRSQVPPE